MSHKPTYEELEQRVRELEQAESQRKQIEITNRKKAESILERVRYSIDKVTDTILWVDENGKFIDANEGACQNLGYDYQELMTKGVADIDPYFSEKQWPSHWEEITKRGKMVLESVHQTKDGNRFPVEIILHNQKFQNKRYNCVYARDITERKEFENALRDSEKKFRLLFNNSADAHFLYDGAQFIDCNLAAIQMFKFKDKNQLLKLHPSEISPL